MAICPERADRYNKITLNLVFTMTDTGKKKTKQTEFLGKLPFTTKLRLFMILPVLGFCLLFLAFFVYNAHNTGMDGLTKLGIILSRDLAWESELGVLANDQRFLQLPLDIHYKQEDVAYVMIYDKEGKLLTGKSKFTFNTPLPDKAFDGFLIDEVKSQIRQFHQFQIYEFIQPISTIEMKQSQETLMFGAEDKPLQPGLSLATPKAEKPAKEKKHIIGYVRLGFSTDRVEANINKIIKFGLLVTGLFLILGVLTTYAIAKPLTRPIATLTGGVKAIINGDLKQHIEIHAEDEFADLAEAFNEMSKRLKNRMEEIRQKNEELENFAHTVSHDLKAPLISIQGFSSMLKKKHKDGLGEKGEFYLERIQKNVEQMDRLIHDLLRLSRIGRVKGTGEPVATEGVVKEIIQEFLPQIKEKKIDFVITLDLPVVYANKTQVHQIFSNLIGNAIKFIGNNPDPQIEIASEKVNDYYKFMIKDNGIGIETPYHERIFGMFQRLDNKTEGTGVGLAIVKRLVEMEGGKIEMESAPGEGTVFYFTLPAKEFQQI